MKILSGLEMENDFIPEILNIDRQVYAEDMQGTYNSVYSRFEKNKDSYILAIDEVNDKIIGYFCFFPITEKLFSKIINEDAVYDDNIRPSDICSYKEKNYLFFISAAILPKYQDGIAIRRLTAEFIQFLKQKIRSGHEIEAILAFVISSDGRRFAKRLFFKLKRQISEEFSLYICTKEDLERMLHNAK